MARNLRSGLEHNDVVRYRKGATVLFQIRYIDDLCGHNRAYGLHCCGGEYSAPTDKLTKATEEDLKVWKSYHLDRQI